MEYKFNDIELDEVGFISFVNKVWEGNYDIVKTKEALSKTINITAYENGTLLYFGAQPEKESFYEKNGCKRSLQSYIIEKSDK